MKRNVLIVVIFAITIMLLGGCCCCPTCPISPQEEWTVTIVGEKPYCSDYGDCSLNGCFLNDMRIVAPMAYPRSCVQEYPQFASLADTQRVINDIFGTENIVNKFKEYPGCHRIPFGYAYYQNGSVLFIVATMNSQGKVEFYMVVGNQVFRVYEDYNIGVIEFF
ncbi:MAG: hypothetical protein ACTSQA_06150 [Candidatus Heimdallarchaeaceae archaeon]